jgi:class 3 adenylate cyclase
MSETRKLAAILVTDIVGFSRLTGADEERTLARLRALRGDLVGPAVAAHFGRFVKSTGDGAIIEFRSVVDAVRCAIEMQNGLVERNAGVPPERRIQFRIGIHVGDVVEERDGDLMGGGVNIAARLEGIAKPGAICLSEDAYRQVKGRLELEVSDLGATQLKNIAEPLRAYLVEVHRPDKPQKQRSASRHRLVAAFATLAILVVAGAVGWSSIANKPSTIVSSSTAPTASTTPTTSSFGPNVDTTPATGNQPTTPTASSSERTVDVTPAGNEPPPPPRAATQRQVKPALTSQPDAQPTARKVVRSLANGRPSRSEPAKSASVAGASDFSQPCYPSAAQTNPNHVSCGYLRGQPSSVEPQQSPSVESASNSSELCFNSAAQTSGNHPSCAYLRGY